MHDLVIFIAGAAFAFLFIVVFSVFAALDMRRIVEQQQHRRPGYLDFTTTSSFNAEGRDEPLLHNADVDPPGGGDDLPPPHLRLVRERKH